jgi:8-oxo-dGTP pyrophosphatase MutT (NUDIX family)
VSSIEYPNLFREADTGTGICKFALCDTPPPAALTSNVNLVPFVGEQSVVVRMLYPQGPIWEIPGGTLEPGESYLDTVRREVWEEAGARLLTFRLFGAWYCRSPLPAPYRPHLPHPNYYRVVGYGEVELLGAPQSVEGGESVISVECVMVEEAARRFHDTGRGDLAELYQLAAYIRSIRDSMNDTLRFEDC